MRIVLITLALMLLVALPAHAILYDTYSYNVQGVLAIPGNNACPNGICVEALAFSFRFAYVRALPDEDLYRPTWDGGKTISVGPLGSFHLDPNSEFFQEWIAFITAGLQPPPGSETHAIDEIDLLLGGNIGGGATMTPWVAPGFGLAQLFACRSPECVTAFGNGTPQTNFQLYGPAVTIVTPISEPGTLDLIVVGALAILAILAFSRRPALLAR